MRRAGVALLFCAACAGPIEPRLSVLEARVFAPNCTFSSCHSALGHAGGLTLEAGKAHASLVGVAAQQDTASAEGWVRVAPGDVLHSFLILKLREHVDARYGIRMPNGAETLSPEEFAAVAEWVRLGAQDD